MRQDSFLSIDLRRRGQRLRAAGATGAFCGFAILMCGCGAPQRSEALDVTAARAAVEWNEPDRSAPAPVDAAEVASHLDEGDRAMAESRYEDAARAYRAALSLSPGHSEAEQGLEDARRMLNDGSTLSATVMHLSLRRQATLAEVDAAYQRAENAMWKHNFADARGEVLAALARLDRGRQYLATSEYESLHERGRTLLDRVEERRESVRPDHF